MFWKKKKPSPKARPAVEATGPRARRGDQHPAVQPLKTAIAAKEGENPHIRAQITAKELVANMLEALKDERGVRVETLLGALGSFAGFSIVYAMVRRLDDGTLKPALPEVMIVELKDGQTYYFGEYINRRLAQDKLSVFGLSAGMAQQAGATDLPDLNELFERTAANLGKADFGRPQLPPDHHTGDLPVNFVKSAYASYLGVLGRYNLSPDDYYLACAFAIQEVITMSKGTIDPNLAIKIVMECAVPASKLDPRVVMNEVSV